MTGIYSLVPVLLAAFAFVMTLVGGAVALRAGDRRHLVLGLAAGLMLGVVGFDLIPEALDFQHRQLFHVPDVLLMFVAGFLTLHAVERAVAVHRAHEDEYAPHVHGHSHAHDPTKGIGLAAASALVGHSVADGFAIGAAYQAGRSVGAVVAIAVISHDFADGFNAYTITRLYGNDRHRALLLLSADALAPIVGAAITLAVTIPPGPLGLYLGFFAGLLLYLATSDILPEAHSPHPSLATLASTWSDAALMWLLIGLAG